MPDAERCAQCTAGIAGRKLDVVADPNYIGLARALMGEAIRSPGFLESKWSELSALEGGLTRWIEAAADDVNLRVTPVVKAVQRSAIRRSPMGTDPRRRHS